MLKGKEWLLSKSYQINAMTVRMLYIVEPAPPSPLATYISRVALVVVSVPMFWHYGGNRAHFPPQQLHLHIIGRELHEMTHGVTLHRILVNCQEFLIVRGLHHIAQRDLGANRGHSLSGGRFGNGLAPWWLQFCYAISYATYPSIGLLQ